MPDHPLLPLVSGMLNAYCPLPGVVTGGQPSREHLQALADAGVKVVLDLRLPNEPRPFDEPAEVEAAGMEYVLVPVQGAVPDASFDAVRALLADPAKRPVLFHCASANRVGALLLPYLMLNEGQSRDEAVGTAKAVGLRDPMLAQLALDYVRRQSAP
jgi:protein tyrosine phosphatase (PTP) superfamily phosphohydrolase (DUF442 family)